MTGQGSMALMRIYTDEKAKGDDGPLHTSIIEKAREARLAGATLLRGAVGFGVSGNVQRESILDLSFNLPLVLEFVDEDAKLRTFFGTLKGMTDIGLVTIEPIEVLHYGGAKPLGDDVLDAA